jgi:subtilisin family serine protease
MLRSQVSVVNMSMSGPHDELLERAIADMSARGVLFVAAAGNGGPNGRPSYPAAYEQVIAVTAVDKNLRSYIHANHGDYIDVAAPGVGIWTALPGVLEGYQSGTSFAAPYVTAIVAAVHGQVGDKSKEGFLKALAIRDLGQVGRDRVYGRGLVIAPSACSSGEEPNGWVTDVVHAPTPSLLPPPSSLTSSFR